MVKRTDGIYLTLPSDRYTPFSLARKIGAKAILVSMPARFFLNLPVSDFRF